jgi:ATP-dependent DNA helicase RecQ
MPRDIHEVLRSVWGHAGFRPVQEKVVRSMMERRDTLAMLPTGGGKSICFQVPALAMERMCLVVSPLIALMKDQVEHLRQHGVRAVAITSGMGHAEIDIALDNAVHGKVDFLYVSPERLGSELFAARLPRLPIGLIAVDEAHCISQWGYDFRPAYLLIGNIRQAHPDIPVLALTASATSEVVQDIMRRLDFKKPNVLRGSLHRPELTFWVSRGEDKLGRLLRIARNTAGSGIVYLRDRRGTVRIAEFLRHHGIAALAYHAGLSFEERDRVQRAWMEGESRFVAATNAFGMGIDKADVRCVVHMEPPPDIESYYQESGRAGRDGRPAFAFLLTHGQDAEKLRERSEASFPSLGEVRRVYQAFADQHRIALGAGEFESYALDLRELAKRTGLSTSGVKSSLKALELNGDIALSDGARAPSRVFMRAEAATVYRLRVNDARLGPMVEALLRMHGGLFEEPSVIDEEGLAKHLSLSVERVRAALLDLDRMHVIFYRPRNDSPQVTLLIPRRDTQRLDLDKEALAKRKERARVRTEAVLRFISDTYRCREAAVLNYFGEHTEEDCGRCDNCVARKSANLAGRPPARWNMDEGSLADSSRIAK